MTTPYRRRSRTYVLRALAALAVPIAVPFSSRSAAAETYTMRLNHSDSASGVVGLAALRFSAAVERRSNGQLKIEVYPSGQLASQAASVDGLATGVIDLAITGSAWLEPLLPAFQVFDLPFLFKDLTVAHRVIDGPIGNEFFAQLDSKGIVGLGWGENGFQQLETVSKAVTVPDDLKGARIRIQAGAVYVATYQALGAVPVVIDNVETLVALTQHTVDGTAVGLENFMGNKWYTVAKHVAMTNHLLSLTPLLGSKRKIDALPPALQRIVREEGKAVIGYWRSLIAPRLAEATAFLKQNGVVFNDVQYPAFRRAMEPVYATLQSKVGADLLERVTRAANAT